MAYPTAIPGSAPVRLLKFSFNDCGSLSSISTQDKVEEGDCVWKLHFKFDYVSWFWWNLKNFTLIQILTNFFILFFFHKGKEKRIFKSKLENFFPFEFLFPSCIFFCLLISLLFTSFHFFFLFTIHSCFVSYCSPLWIWIRREHLFFKSFVIFFTFSR